MQPRDPGGHCLLSCKPSSASASHLHAGTRGEGCFPPSRCSQAALCRNVCVSPCLARGCGRGRGWVVPGGGAERAAAAAPSAHCFCHLATVPLRQLGCGVILGKGRKKTTTTTTNKKQQHIQHPSVSALPTEWGGGVAISEIRGRMDLPKIAKDLLA